MLDAHQLRAACRQLFEFGFVLLDAYEDACQVQAAVAGLNVSVEIRPNPTGRWRVELEPAGRRA